MTYRNISRSTRLPLLAALVTVLLWASAFPAIRLALDDFDPIPLASLRFGCAGIIMLIWMCLKRPQLPKGRDWLHVALCAGIGIALYNILLNSGQRTISSGAASFIINTSPVITTFLAILFLNERFGKWVWAGSLISFCGVVLIALEQPGGIVFGKGATQVLGAAFCQAVFFTLQRPLIQKYGAMTCAALAMIFGGLFLAPALPEAISQATYASASSLTAMVWLILFPGVAGFITWAFAQGHYGSGRAANFLYLVPFTATLIAVPTLAEIPTSGGIIGGMLAIAGVILINLLGKEPTRFPK